LRGRQNYAIRQGPIGDVDRGEGSILTGRIAQHKFFSLEETARIRLTLSGAFWGFSGLVGADRWRLRLVRLAAQQRNGTQAYWGA
jgi:hypothetical protein